MGKALVATGVVAATGTIAVPAVLLSGSSSWEDEEAIKQESQWQGLMPELNSSKDIKNVYQKNNCFKEGTQNIESWEGSDSTGSTEDLNFDPSKISGCLVVEYYKQTYSDSKWRGKFKFVWSLFGTGNNGKGFITVVYAQTQGTKLLIDFSFYVIKESGSKWSVSRNTNVKKETSNNEDLSKWLPQPGDIIEKDKSNQYWGFDPDLTRICKKGTCGKRNGEAVKSSLSWNISAENNGDSQQQTITNLFTNFNNWFTNSLNDGGTLAGQISSTNPNIKLTKQNGES